MVKVTLPDKTMALESHQETSELVPHRPSPPSASANCLGIKGWSAAHHQTTASPTEGVPVAAVRPFCRSFDNLGGACWTRPFVLNQIGELVYILRSKKHVRAM